MGWKKLILFGSRARNEATEDSDRYYPLVRCLPPASFRFQLTMDTLALGYTLPAIGRVTDLHRLENVRAGRT